MLKNRKNLTLIYSLENDSPSRGRKLNISVVMVKFNICLENDSPSRGRKHARRASITA